MPEVWSRYLGTVKDGKLRLHDRGRWYQEVRSLEGKTLEVLIAPARNRRTLPQNSKLHVVARAVAEESGESLDRIKRLATLEALGIEAGTTRETILGREFLIVRRTSDLSKEEAARVVSNLLDKAAFLGITLPPDDTVEVMG